MQKNKNYQLILLLIVFAFSIASCSDPIIDDTITVFNLDEKTRGSGFVEFKYKTSLSEKIIKTFYYIPQNSNSQTSIVMLLHGAGRNAREYRDAIVSKANEYNFIVIAPEFSAKNYPGGDGYNLGNVFLDGDNPTDNSLNTESEWAFSVINPLFNFIKNKTRNSSERYHMIGHSAGAQFAHRFVMFKPNTNINHVILSAAGWYTVPDFSVNFPYGFQKSPLENINLKNLFNVSISIQIGELDNNPNAPGLRKNQYTAIQGSNRFQRAYHFYNKSKSFADLNGHPFKWRIQTNEGLDHDFKAAIRIAADTIFN